MPNSNNYQIFKDSNNNMRFIFRINDGASIPIDENNRDYKEYLAWLAEGNQPLPPDEPVINNK